MRNLLPVALITVAACSSGPKARIPQNLADEMVPLSQVYATLDAFPEGDFEGRDGDNQVCHVVITKQALPQEHRFLSVLISDREQHPYTFRFSDAEGVSKAGRTTILKDFRPRADGYSVNAEFYGTEGQWATPRQFFNAVDVVRLYGTGETEFTVREDRSNIVAGSREWAHSCKVRL